jgi:outer membrane lipoprotein-sorting protein
MLGKGKSWFLSNNSQAAGPVGSASSLLSGHVYLYLMKQIFSAFVLGATVLFAPAAQAAEKLGLNAISTYINDMKTAEAEFTQISDDGFISTGTLYIKRPGKMRFEYDPPNFGVVVAGNNTVAIVDKKSNQRPETYPLSKTPLSLILARTVNLAEANMVVDHGFDGTATTVTAQDPKHPERGNIEMSFTGLPIELRKWVIKGETGERTTVILGAMETGHDLRQTLFDPNRPVLDR